MMGALQIENGVRERFCAERLVNIEKSTAPTPAAHSLKTQSANRPIILEAKMAADASGGRERFQLGSGP